jgi:hypothetical protein
VLQNGQLGAPGGLLRPRGTDRVASRYINQRAPAAENNFRSGQPATERPMEVVLIILVLVLLFGGGGYYGRRRGHW